MMIFFSTQIVRNQARITQPPTARKRARLTRWRTRSVETPESSTKSGATPGRVAALQTRFKRTRGSARVARAKESGEAARDYGNDEEVTGPEVHIAGSGRFFILAGVSFCAAGRVDR